MYAVSHLRSLSRPARTLDDRLRFSQKEKKTKNSVRLISNASDCEATIWRFFCLSFWCLFEFWDEKCFHDDGESRGLEWGARLRFRRVGFLWFPIGDAFSTTRVGGVCQPDWYQTEALANELMLPGIVYPPLNHHKLFIKPSVRGGKMVNLNIGSHLAHMVVFVDASRIIIKFNFSRIIFSHFSREAIEPWKLLITNPQDA